MVISSKTKEGDHGLLRSDTWTIVYLGDHKNGIIIVMTELIIKFTGGSNTE